MSAPAHARREPGSVFGCRKRNLVPSFTLIEMVIVIGIIVLLAALTFAVGVAVHQNSEARQTQATISLLDAAMKEWEAQSDRKLMWTDTTNPGDPGDFADIHASTQGILSVTEVLGVITKVSQVRELIARIDPQFIYTYKPPAYPPWIRTPAEQSQVDALPANSITVLDAWGTPIYSTHPGRLWGAGPSPDPPADRDADGTLRTDAEKVCGVTANRQMCFVSPGPDGQVGNLNLPHDSPEWSQAQDNLYSYTPTPYSYTPTP